VKQIMDDWGRPIILWAVMGLFVFAGGRATSAWDAIAEKTENAVSQQKFEGLDDTVRSLERSLDKLLGLRGDIAVLTSQISELNSAAQGFALTQQTVARNDSEITRLRKRGQYMRDSVNRVCERLDMVCATRNAMYVPPSPWPKPQHYGLRVALHESAGEGWRVRWPVLHVGHGA